jgi:hypothetical protein
MSPPYRVFAVVLFELVEYFAQNACPYTPFRLQSSGAAADCFILASARGCVHQLIECESDVHWALSVRREEDAGCHPECGDDAAKDTSDQKYQKK